MSDRLSEAQMADISSYDPVAGTWAEHATLPHPLRAPIALVIGDRLLVANGSRWFAEAPQTTTWVAPCNETPGSPCARVATGTAEARAAVRNGLKALVTRLPTRLQGLLQLDRVILHAAGGRP